MGFLGEGDEAICKAGPAILAGQRCGSRKKVSWCGGKVPEHRNQTDLGVAVPPEGLRIPHLWSRG